MNEFLLTDLKSFKTSRWSPVGSETIVWAKNITFWGRISFSLLAIDCKKVSLMSFKSQGMYSSIQEPGNCWNHKFKCHLVPKDAYKTQTTSSQPSCLLEFLKQDCKIFKEPTLWHDWHRPRANKETLELVSQFQNRAPQGACAIGDELLCFV